MIGGITYMGWFHTIVGIPAIIVGLYILFRDRFIFINTGLAKFYLIATVITSASSLFIFRATGAFNMAHFNSVIIILAVLFACILNKIIFTSINGKISKHIKFTFAINIHYQISITISVYSTP